LRAKRHKNYWRASVNVPALAEDAVMELFSRIFGAPCASYHDLETGQSTVSAFVENVRIYKESREDLARGLQIIKQCGLLTKVPRIRCVRLKREDWAESWKRHFPPLEISDRLLIKPSWSRRKAKKGQAVVVLDPGLSFGTGNHPTTSYCLRKLPGVADKNACGAFLDAGTGSGILAISAAKLGFSPVHAFDFDPESIGIAKANAKRNRIEKKVRFSKRDAKSFKSPQRYALICANLSRDVLEKTISIWRDHLAPQGIVVFAGLLQNEFDLIAAAAERTGLRLLKRKTKNEWCSGTFQKLTSRRER
jgi:ribosomal protein L11 methyltransferase